MSTKKKQSFLGGAAILASAVAIVKILGAVYKIPFGNIVGPKGQTYFNVAYNIYNVLLTISTAGLPLAISKLTSQAHTQGRENQICRKAVHFGAYTYEAFLVVLYVRQPWQEGGCYCLGNSGNTHFAPFVGLCIISE